jgi:hypothetical protein
MQKSGAKARANVRELKIEFGFDGILGAEFFNRLYRTVIPGRATNRPRDYSLRGAGNEAD